MSDSTGITLPLQNNAYSLPSIIDDTTGTFLYTSGIFDRKNFTEAEKAVSVEWQVGDTILDLYKVTEILGMGAFGKVYKVLHKGWNIPLAVKTLRAELAENKGHKEAFIKECQGWVNLGLHPNIVPCYYVRELGGLPRIFLEYAEGGSLRGRLKKNQDPEWKEILDFAIQCLDGLSFAHSKGLIHRDIKPANCLITKNGELKVTDFGIAAGLENISASPEDKPSLEKTMMTEGAVGTPAYMPPEQWDKDYGKTGPWSDIYSLGIMLFEMCCKKRPFDAGVEHTGVIKMRHINEAPPAPDKTNQKIPRTLSDFILKCLKKKTRERFQTCDEARFELVRIYKSLTGEEYPREKPEEASLLADGLNNRAVSLIDLGMREEALNIWKEALRADFLHLPSTFNSLLVKWRDGKITDIDAIKGLENILKERPERLAVNYYLGLIHLERDSTKEAIEKLKEAVTVERERKHIKKAIKEAEKRLSLSTGMFKEIRFERNEEPESLTINPDGKKAFISTRKRTQKDFSNRKDPDEGNYHILDLEKGEIIKKKVCFPFRFSFISADGRWAISAGNTDFANLWNLQIAAGLVKDFPAPPEGRCSVTLSSDRKYFAEGGKDGIVYLHDTYTGKTIKKLAGHKGAVTVLHFSPDGKELISGSLEGEWSSGGVKMGKAKFNLWHVGAEKILRDFETPEEVESVNFSSDGKIGVTINGNELKVWDIIKKKCTNKCFIPRKKTASKKISLSKDGSFALTYGESEQRTKKSCSLWNTKKGTCRRTITSPVASDFAISGDGRKIVFWEINWIWSFVQIWNINIENLTNFHSPFALSYIGQAKAMLKSQSHFKKLIGEAEKSIEEKNWNNAVDILWQARNLPNYELNPRMMALWQKLYKNCKKIGINSVRKIKTIEDKENGIGALAISVDGKILVTSGRGTIKIWELPDGKCIKTIKDRGDERAALSIAISSDGQFIVSGHFDGSVKLWNVKGNLIKTLKEHKQFIRSITISRDGKWILSGSYNDKEIKLWDFERGRSIRTFKGHNKDLVSLRFSFDNQKIYSMDHDAIKIWNISDGTCIRTIDKAGGSLHFDDISAMALTGGSYDRNTRQSCLRLWDFTSGKCITSFPTGTSTIPIVMTCDLQWAFCADTLWDIQQKKALRKLEYSTRAVWSPDGSLLLTAGREDTINMWMIDWQLEPLSPADCGEEIIPYLKNFLRAHIPYSEKFKAGNLTEDNIKRALKREGTPQWNDKDFKELIQRLQYSGYGNVKEDSIKKELERLKKEDLKEHEPPLEDALIIQAAKSLSFEGLKEALDKGADPDYCDSQGNASFHWVIMNSRRKNVEKILKLLIEKGANPGLKNHSHGSNPVELAGTRIFFNNALEEILLKEIIALTETSPEGIIDKFEVSPIHLFCIRNNTEEVKAVLKADNVNSSDILGNTPLHYAALTGNKDIAKILIEKGGNAESKNNFGRTPLHYGARKGNHNIIEIFIKKGLDLNIKDTVDWTPLHFAAKGKCKKTAEILLKNGAKIEAKNSDYKTPLEISVIEGSKEVIEVLAEEDKDKESSKTLNLAVKHDRKDVLQLLLEKGFDINGKSTLDDRPLHIAAREGNIEIAKILLDNGADLDLIWYEITSTTVTRVEKLGWHVFSRSNLGKLYGKVDAVKLDFINSSKLMGEIHSGQKILNYLRSGVVIIKEEEVKHLLNKIWPGHLKFIEPFINRNIFQHEFFDRMCSLGYGNLYYDINKKSKKIINYNTGDISIIERDTNIRVPYEKIKKMKSLQNKEMARSVIEEKLKEEGFSEDEIAVVLGQATFINKSGDTRRAPLHYAVLKGHKEMIRLFIDRGADVTLRDCNLKTPFQLTEDEDIKNILLKGYERKEKEEKKDGGGFFSYLRKLFGR